MPTGQSVFAQFWIFPFSRIFEFSYKSATKLYPITFRNNNKIMQINSDVVNFSYTNLQILYVYNQAHTYN